MLQCVKDPYQFEPYHVAIREPFDYYKLGNDFASGVINREDSKIIGLCTIITPLPSSLRESISPRIDVLSLHVHSQALRR